ncbi:MAG: glycosyltransferase family 4 protein [Verrucomicrobiota bacterium]
MTEPRRIVYLTAGAGGMYCGSCIRDNALTAGLQELGWDVTLLPLYTPIRTDDEDRSVDQVFFGGINVYLQQKIPLFRYLPKFVDRWLDRPGLLRRVASRSVSVNAKELGELTLSMARGEDGNQRKEVRELVHWMREVAKPDLIVLTNLLVGGAIPALKREVGVPILVTLQGDDLFLDELEPPYHDLVLAEMRRLAAAADGFITFSEFYRDKMASLFEVDRDRFFLTPLGVDTEAIPAKESANDSGIETIGYLARLAPEKGFDLLVDAFVKLARENESIRLRFAGWLAEKDRDFFNEQIAKLDSANLSDRYDHCEVDDHDAKVAFLHSLDCFAVPTRFDEPKGLYALEAWSAGLPVVVPDHGAFPGLIEASGGGRLCAPEDASSLAEVLGNLVSDPDQARAAGGRGSRWVREQASRAAMASGTAEAFERVLGGMAGSVKALR